MGTCARWNPSFVGRRDHFDCNSSTTLKLIRCRRRYIGPEQRNAAITTDLERRQADQTRKLHCHFDLASTIVSVSTEFAAFFQCEPTDLVGCQVTDLGPGTLRREITGAIERAENLSLDNPVTTRESHGLDHWGRSHWIEWTERLIFDEKRRRRGFELSGRDVTAEHMAAETAAYEASFDPLTGALNIESFRFAVGQALQQARIRQFPVGILLADISTISGSDGSHAKPTDRIREEVAERIVATFRSTDAVARIGADQFAVLCPDLHGGQAIRALLQRLEYIVGEPMIGLDALRVQTRCAWVVSDGYEEVDALMQELMVKLGPTPVAKTSLTTAP